MLKSDNFTPTKHLDYNQLWRTHYTLPINTNCVEYNFEIRLYGKTRNSAITLCGVMISCGWKNPPNSIPEFVNTMQRYAARLNKDQIITAVNDILPSA